MVAASVNPPGSVPVAPLSDAPGVVVLNWSPANIGLVNELTRTMAGAGVARITCVGDELTADREEPDRPSPDTLELRMLAMPARSSFDALVEFLTEKVRIVEARAVIVLPRTDVSEPDSISRRTCAAIRRACGEHSGPNVLVEVEDPEAAFEFVGLEVATVFYSGHLRAALLGQACVDLGVFQFILGLLHGRHSIRTIEVPANLREGSFADAAIELEVDARGRPMTVIGIARPASALDQGGVLVNPGPATPLRTVLGLVALVSGDSAQELQR